MHYRLVSLWDIMMHQFESRKFIEAYTLLVSLGTAMRNWEEGRGKRWDPKTEDNERFVREARSLHEQLQELGLRLSARTAQRVVECLETGAELKEIDQRIEELYGRIGDELETRILLVVPSEHEELYRPSAPLFGVEVFNAFPSANDDIAEGGMCLALGRGTACVMHLNRAQEVALRALAKVVNVVQQNDWGAYIREIDRELNARMKVAGKRTADEQFYSEANAAFDTVKRAYRNPTAHPEKSYSSERAEEIFGATRSFMKHLATKISE